jgi:hypothetical protein
MAGKQMSAALAVLGIVLAFAAGVLLAPRILILRPSPPPPPVRAGIAGMADCTAQVIQVLDQDPGTDPEVCWAYEGDTITWEHKVSGQSASFTIDFDSNDHPFPTKSHYDDTHSTSEKVKHHLKSKYYKYSVQVPGQPKRDPHVIIMGGN